MIIYYENNNIDKTGYIYNRIRFGLDRNGIMNHFLILHTCIPLFSVWNFNLQFLSDTREYIMIAI